jgi:hypothetical protein
MKNSNWFSKFKKACYFFSLIAWISFFMLLSFRSGVNYGKEEEYKNVQEIIEKTRKTLKNKENEIKTLNFICEQNENFSIETIKNLENDVLTLYFLLILLKEAEEKKTEKFHCLPKEFL